jgi:hypothetical protein
MSYGWPFHFYRELIELAVLSCVPAR